MTKLIQCQALSKAYHDGEIDIQVLNALDFEIQLGESVAIIGPSGSGKSTLLHLLGGLDKPTTGTVTVLGQDINAMSEAKRCRLRNHALGFIYQFHHLLPEFSALENVAMPLLIRGNSVSDARVAAESMLERVGLAERTSHKLSQLSGGERQRTAIARALVTRPQCVLADEPTGNLDNQTAARVFDTMMAVRSEVNTALLVVTHDLALAAKMDRVYRLEGGVLQATTVSAQSPFADNRPTPNHTDANVGQPREN